MPKKIIHIITHRSWQAEELQSKGWETRHSLGLEVPAHMPKDAWWMPQAYAVRLNKSLLHHGYPALNLTAPTSNLLAVTPREHTGRRVGVVTVYDALNSFVEWPDSLWWKMATAKHDNFLAKPRTHQELMDDIQHLPLDSLLQFSEALPSILSEFRFFILNRQVEAFSGYLNRGVTIYDGATFSSEETNSAYRKAEQLLADDSLDLPKAFVLDIAVTVDGAYILEYNPAWCSGWYECSIPGVMETIRVSTNPTKKEMKLWAYEPDAFHLSSPSRPLPLA